MWVVDLFDVHWEGVANGDTAHVDASLNLEETLVAPFGSPRVLDDPVIFTFLRTVADSEHGMVDVLSGVLAGLGCVNSSLVVSESINNLEGNRHWSPVENSFSKRDLVTFSDIVGATLDLQSVLIRLHSAVVVNCEVWVVFLSGNTTVIHNVFECMGWKTSVAAMIVEGTCAVYELLFRVKISSVLLFPRFGWTILDQFVSFEASHSGEGPAATAVALILYW